MSFLEKLTRDAPRTITLPLRIMPFAPQRLCLQKMLQNIFAEALAEGDFDFLMHRWLCIDIENLDLRWYFSVDEQRKMLIENQGQSHATIKGGWKAFLELAARQKDPDSLFFQRKLLIEGDTDLCHGVKNLLDGIELSDRAQRLQRGLASLNILINPK